MHYEYPNDNGQVFSAQFESLDGNIHVVKYQKDLESVSFNVITSSVELEVISLGAHEPSSVTWSFIQGWYV